MSVISEIAPQAPAADIKKGPSKLGQEDFLQLLVAQMENQDPTKPMDNFQFLSQLAQFGMVDGIQNLQTSFGSVADSFKQSQLLQASSLLDRDVLSPGNVVSLTGSAEIKGFVNVSGQASQIDVEIRSSSGILVDTLKLGASNGGEVAFSWNGRNSDGDALPQGQYFVHAKGFSDGEIRELPVDTLNRVTSVVIDEGARVSLTLSTGEEVDLASVKEIR
jgi:flagellar basal-body rod modification protein FlgD